jgi:hypothetical protein
MEWHPSYTDGFSGATATRTDVQTQEDHLRMRIQQLNHQIDDLSCTLQIPRGDLLACVNRMLAAAKRPHR